MVGYACDIVKRAGNDREGEKKDGAAWIQYENARCAKREPNELELEKAM